jgi:hypothetical protein
MALNLYNSLWLKICTVAYGSKSVQLPTDQNLFGIVGSVACGSKYVRYPRAQSLIGSLRIKICSVS